MAVIADTSVWIQFLRVGGPREHRELDRLLAQGDVVMVGVVMAELLQGARNPQEYEELGVRLAGLPYVSETKNTWVQVGTLSYRLRQEGLAVGAMDLLIAALALEHGHEVYTLDEHFQRIPGLRLHEAHSE